MSAAHALVPAATERRQPDPQHHHLRRLRPHHPRHRHPGVEEQPQRRRLLRRRPRVHRAAERHRHRRRLPVGGELPRHRRRHRPQRLRRLPLLDRLPRRVAGRPAARRRAAAQRGQVHDGRRPVVPPQAAAGPDGRGDLDPRGLLLLPARPDGRGRWPRRAAARHRRQDRAVPGHRRRRRHHDRLRPHRRHEGHHLGADHQGRAADPRRRRDVPLGAEQVRAQPQLAAR